MEREEIVKALRDECEDCSECSKINGECISLFYCPNRDAADLIEQQASENAKLAALDKVQQETIVAQTARIAELEAQLAAHEQAEKDGLIVRLPCKVGDTVYVVASCAEVITFRDDDYFTGTGATECPFENDCNIEECDDNNIRIFKTECTGFMPDENLKLITFFDGLSLDNDFNCWGKTVFLTPEAAEAALKEQEARK